MKTLGVWLRMVANADPNPIPTSEDEYLAHLPYINIAMPTNGGTLQDDGTWYQDPNRLNPAWPQSLPGVTRGAEHQYIPMVNDEPGEIETVLDNAALQAAASNELVGLATTSRFDSPWDGVLIDLEGAGAAYQNKLSTFYRLLVQDLHAAGIQVGISVRGRTGDAGPDYDDAYGPDFAVVAEIADFIDLRCYGYWLPQPRSIAPHWWIVDCIEYALAKGMSADKILLGLGIFSGYWADASQWWTMQAVTHARATSLIDAAGSSARWIELGPNGLNREYYALLGSACAWLHDGRTLRDSLDLVDSYGLMGTALFIPGMGDESVWRTLMEWKKSEAPMHPYVYSPGGLFAGGF